MPSNESMKAALEINRINRARGHVLTDAGGRTDDVMPTLEMAEVVERAIAESRGQADGKIIGHTIYNHEKQTAKFVRGDGEPSSAPPNRWDQFAFRALQKIADNYGGCHCDHSDESCCENPSVGEFCPHCIAEIALSGYQAYLAAYAEEVDPALWGTLAAKPWTAEEFKKVRSGAAQEVSPATGTTSDPRTGYLKQEVSPPSPATFDEWWAESRTLNPDCGCEHRGQRWFKCSYHEGAADAWDAKKLGDTRELKAALGQLMRCVEKGDKGWTLGDQLNLQKAYARAERLLGEPTKE